LPCLASPHHHDERSESWHQRSGCSEEEPISFEGVSAKDFIDNARLPAAESDSLTFTLNGSQREGLLVGTVILGI